MKSFCFTIDDNIRFFKEITEQNLKSIFDHPYLAMLARLHNKFGAKIQLNLFFKTDGFDLSQMSERYVDEWLAAADWLRLSFHSEFENRNPYEHSGYDEVFGHCHAVQKQILRFASPESLASTTTVHYCRTTDEGVSALSDNGVRGLLGLFGTDESPRTSYGIDEPTAARLRGGETVCVDGMAFASIDMIINAVKKEKLLPNLEKLMTRKSIRVMIHEQYFYADYHAYQPDFEEKLEIVLSALVDEGYQSVFFEELL